MGDPTEQSESAEEGRLPSLQFVAEAGDPLDRLDKFVVARLVRIGERGSRAQVQKWIRAARVTVNGLVGDPSDRVVLGAVVCVAPLPPEVTHLEPDASVAFDILFEDDELLVVDKPGGMVVHPSRGHTEKTLVHGLLARGSFARWAPAEGEPLASVRPGIVHRLDKGTSGILVVAKTERAREGLKDLFARHAIERAYWAIVVGAPREQTIETLHGRHRTDRLKFTSRVSSGKRAVTRVRVLEKLRDGKATLIECRLETGRTHQIRVHLCEVAGTPILGDPLYGRTPSDPELRELALRLGRQALHAAVLGFVHPVTGEKLRFEREPPADFNLVLAALRGGAPRRRA